MSVKRNDKIFPWLYHGGPIELGSLMKQVIEITVTFPHTGSQGQWVCAPVTLNLSTDIGVTSNTRVYAVDWEGSDSTTTITNTMNSFKHEHKFVLNGTQPEFTKKYNITLYGDPLLPHQGYSYGLGEGNTGYKVVSKQISLTKKEQRQLERELRLDRNIPSGSRITRAFFGDKIVYGKIFAGSELYVDIELDGSANNIRLVNPLVSDYNDWNDRKTDARIDWGDGSISYVVNQYINSGVCNTGSTYKIEHKYHGSSGQKFTIKINAVEPLIPVGCKVLALYGSLPEDCYIGSDMGLFTYNQEQIKSHAFRAQLSDHKKTINRLGSDLCNNWVRTTKMINTFKDWISIQSIDKGFFKENILSICSVYDSTFSNTTALKTIDPLLLGTENNVVTQIKNMFWRSSVSNTLDLKVANNLETILGMFGYTKVTKADNFLYTAPKLRISKSAFEGSLLSSHSSNMMSDSKILNDSSYMFKNSKMINIVMDFKIYSNLSKPIAMYEGCPLNTINSNTFGGNFAKDVPDGQLDISRMFANIGTDNTKTRIEAGSFQSLSMVSNKLKSNMSSFLENAKIDQLHNDMFKSVFKSQSARFELVNWFTGLKTNDSFGYDRPCIRITRVFSDCGGVLKLINTFGLCNIGYIDADVYKDLVDMIDVSSMFKSAYIHTRLQESMFSRNKKIIKWDGLFHNATIVYNDTPIDRIVYSDVNDIDITNMLNTANDIMVYRLFSHDSKVKNIDSNGAWIRNKQSLPLEIIFGDRITNITDKTYDVRPMVYDIAVMQDNTVVELTPESPTECAIQFDIDTEYMNSYSLPANHTYNKGHHRISIISDKSVKLTGKGFYVIRLSGEYPYNSKPDFSNCPHYKLREIDRNVFAVCNHAHIHNSPYFNEYIPILHKDIFKYHDDVSSSTYFNMDKYKLKGMYGIQPGMLNEMTKLNTLEQIYSAEMKVLAPEHIPSNLTLNNKIPNIISTESTSPVVITGDIINNSITDYNVNKAQVISNKTHKVQKGRPDNDYLEFYLEGVTSPLKLIKLKDEPTFPITVEILSKSISGAQKAIINGFNDDININGAIYVRVYSDKPVWIDQKDKIKELYGSIPPCEWTYMMKDLCPGLRRVGDKLLIHLTNRSIRNMFSHLPDFEYFPGTLFWYNPNLVDYESSFYRCPKLFKVDDYIITAKKGQNINCKNMFMDSGVVSVRKPIMDDINAKVDITGMFGGCKTGYFYGVANIDKEMFKNIDTVGNSGIRYEGGSVKNDNDRLYIETNPTNITGLQSSYFIDDRMVPNITDSDALKFASQSIGGQVLAIDRTRLTAEMTKYLPFIYKTETVKNGNMVAGLYDYMEYVTNITTATSHSDNNFIRNNYLVDISSLYKGANFNNVNIGLMIPYVMKGVKYARCLFEDSTGVSIPDNWKFNTHIISDAMYCFKNTNFKISKGIFDNVDKNAINNNSVYITQLCNNNKVQTDEIGVFKAYGVKLKSVGNTGVYAYCSGLVNVDNDMYAGCDLEVLDHHFFGCSKLATLPKINHMNKVISYQHMFEATNIESIPENYIYTTRNDRDIMIDYMFANCPVLFVENTFIDKRCPGNFSIDYSLNDVLTSVGEDLELFGHVKYDNAFEHRSRVILFDERIGWVQTIRTTSDNQSVKITSLQIPDLVGKTLDKVASILWGDDSRPVVIRPGEVITTEHITHTYSKAGDYVFKVMMQGITSYIETTGSNVITTGLPTSFKFGTINDVKTKTLVGMFGTTVETVNTELFTKLEGINTVEVYTDMFKQFKQLRELPVGILDCMPNLNNIDGLLSDTKHGNVNLILKAGLIDKLTKLRSFNRVAYNSNVSSVENGLFKQQHSNITAVIDMLSNSKCIAIPVTLLNSLVNLTDARNMLRNTSGFVLDDSYDNLFKTNTKLSTLDNAFSGVKINGLGANMLNNIGASLKSISGTFGINDNYTPGKDSVNWTIPNGFMNKLTSLVNSSNAFRGRLSLKSYPINLLDATKNTLNTSSAMFRETGITEIHQGTITGKTINMDASYMFYGCVVRNCPKVITSSTGTIKTLGMLKGVSGELSETELFAGVKTDPSNIQSMYRQAFKFFYMDVTLDKDEEVYVTTLENSLPWNEYVVDVQYDSKLTTITENIGTQDQLKQLTKMILTAGNHTIGIRAPFATEIRTTSGTIIKVNRLYGSFGKMKTDTHIQFKKTIYGKASTYTLDDDEFYKYNSHITNLFDAFGDTKIEYAKTNVFKYLSNVTQIEFLFKNAIEFKVKDGYKPSFDNMRKLFNIDYVYANCTALKLNKDYEPFANVNTITSAKFAFFDSGIIVTPRVNTTSLTDVYKIYYGCKGLTTTYADIFDNSNKCTRYNGAFGETPKFTTIEGESDTKSILTNVSLSSDVTLNEMFTSSGLSYQQVMRIVNNLGAFKGNANIKVNCSDMFMNTIVSGTTKGNLRLNINATNKQINTTRMFYNCGIDEIPKNAINITGSLVYSEMFYNCFADKSVQYLDQVFSVSTHNNHTDYRSSELDTLNVFDLDITSAQQSVINLKYVGGVTLPNIRYAEIVVGDNHNVYHGETVDQIQSMNISVPAGTTKVSIYSVPLLMPVKKSGDFLVNGVNAHLSTHRDNWVDWSTRFSFGQYFGDARTFNIRLGGQFYVKDNGFCTLNGIFKGMKHIQSYPRDIFIDYKGGTVDGTNKIVGIIETFADNISLNDIDVGMLQYISGIESIRRTWYNTALTSIKEGTFASCYTIRDTYEAFGNTRINKLPSKLIMINN